MEIYTPIEQAGDLIKQRWADKKLRKSVGDKLKGDIPEILKARPSGLIWRQIGTPDGEFERFLELCKKASVKPLCFEYTQDKFAARNFTKYGLAKLCFKKGLNKKLEMMVEKEKIIDFKDAEKKKICELKTLWGESLVGFHHFLLEEIFPEMKDSIMDISDWVVRNGGIPKNYYSNILSFAICHAVYFEDFDTLDSEIGFENEVILPAFNEVEKYFGVKPIIVRISKEGEQKNNPHWCCYSQRTKEIVSNHIKIFK